MIGDEDLPGTFKFSQVLSAAEPQEVFKVEHMQKEFLFDDPINIQFTSVSAWPGTIMQ